MHRHIHCASVCECDYLRNIYLRNFSVDQQAQARAHSYPYNDCMCPKHLKAFQSAMHRKIIIKRNKKCKKTDVKIRKITILLSLSLWFSYPSNSGVCVCVCVTGVCRVFSLFLFVPIFLPMCGVFFFLSRNTNANALHQNIYQRRKTRMDGWKRDETRNTYNVCANTFVSHKNSPECSAYLTAQ